jgi:hypothetical protein
MHVATSLIQVKSAWLAETAATNHEFGAEK